MTTNTCLKKRIAIFASLVLTFSLQVAAEQRLLTGMVESITNETLNLETAGGRYSLPIGSAQIAYPSGSSANLRKGQWVQIELGNDGAQRIIVQEALPADATHGFTETL